MTSEEGTIKIAEGWELSRHLQTSFENILNSADISAHAAEQISRSINQQASAFEQILQTLKQISEGIDSFVISTKSTTEASVKLKNMANNLHALLENFIGQEGKKKETKGEEAHGKQRTLNANSKRTR